MPVMPWGKYKDTEISEIPSGYLVFCHEELRVREIWLKAAIADELDRRFGYADPTPPPPPRDERRTWTPEAKALVRAVLDAGYKTMAHRFHPDKGGTKADMQRLNDVIARLRTEFNHKEPRQ
jgi:hypothetical protein